MFLIENWELSAEFQIKRGEVIQLLFLIFLESVPPSFLKEVVDVIENAEC